jgi:hypothetical protein
MIATRSDYPRKDANIQQWVGIWLACVALGSMGKHRSHRQATELVISVVN